MHSKIKSTLNIRSVLLFFIKSILCSNQNTCQLATQQSDRSLLFHQLNLLMKQQSISCLYCFISYFFSKLPRQDLKFWLLFKVCQAVLKKQTQMFFDYSQNNSKLYQMSELYQISKLYLKLSIVITLIHYFFVIYLYIQSIYFVNKMFFNNQVEDYRKQKKSFQKSFSYFYNKTKSSARTLYKPVQQDYFLCCKGLIKQLKDDLQLDMNTKDHIKSKFDLVIKQTKKCSGTQKQILGLNVINLFLASQLQGDKNYVSVFEDGFMLLQNAKKHSKDIEDMLIYQRIDRSILYVLHKYPNEVPKWHHKFPKMITNLTYISRQIKNKLTSWQANEIIRNVDEINNCFTDTEIQQPLNLPSNKTTVISINDNESIKIPVKLWEKYINCTNCSQTQKQRLSAKNSACYPNDKKKSRASLLSLHMEKRNYSLLKINPTRNSSFSSKISTRWGNVKQLQQNNLQHNNENESSKTIRSSKTLRNRKNQHEIISSSLSKQHLTSKILHTVINSQMAVSKSQKNPNQIQTQYRNFYLFCELNGCFRILQIEKISVKKILGSYRIKCNVKGFFEDTLQIKVRNDIGRSIKKGGESQLLTEDECRIILANNIRLQKRFLTFSALTSALIDPYVKFNQNKSIIIQNTSSQGKQHFGYIRRYNSFFFVKYEIFPYLDLFTSYVCHEVLRISKRNSIFEKKNAIIYNKNKTGDIFLIGKKKIFNETANELYETQKLPYFEGDMLKNVIQCENSYTQEQIVNGSNFFLEVNEQNLKPITTNIFEQTFKKSKMLERVCKKKKKTKFICTVRTNKGYKIVELDESNKSYYSGKFYKGSLSCDIIQPKNEKTIQIQENFYDYLDCNSCYKTKLQKLTGKYCVKKSKKYAYLLCWISYYDGEFHVSTYIKSIQKTYLFDFQYKVLLKKQKYFLIESVINNLSFIDDPTGIILLKIKQNNLEKLIQPKEVLYMNYQMKKSIKTSGFIQLFYLQNKQENQQKCCKSIMRKYYGLSSQLWNMLIFQLEWQKIFSTYQPKNYSQIRSIVKKYAIKKPINFKKQKNHKLKKCVYFYPHLDFQQILKLDYSSINNIQLSKFNETINFQQISEKIYQTSYGCCTILARSRKAQNKVMKRILKDYYGHIY